MQQCMIRIPKTVYLIFNTEQIPTKYMYGHKYAAYNKQF